MTRVTVDFYFDYLSPYAYLAWHSLRHREALELRPIPVVLGKLLEHWGQLGPAEIAPKRDFVFKHCARLAALASLPFCPPKFHPFNPLIALRVSSTEVAGEAQDRVVHALFQAGWAQGADLGSKDEVATALTASGLDGSGLVERTAELAAKGALRTATESAVALGVFGVPSMIVHGELFWGNDQTDLVERRARGEDPIDPEQAQRQLAREATAVRPRA